LLGFDRRLAIITSYLPVAQRYLLLVWCIAACGLGLYCQLA
jgi:type IV secretory pathway TrbD component